MEARLEAIVGDLRRWMAQQQESGLDRAHLDPEILAAARTAALSGSPPPDVPSATPVSERPRTADKARALAALDRDQVSICTKCKLHETRTQTVFGVGNANADLVIVGEAPGRDEDLQGEPFVGAAGQLLTKILGAIGFAREDVYICNVLKCRPPKNRDPAPEEVVHCEPYLLRQLEILQPKLICCVGRIAAQTLLKTRESLTKMRGRVHDYHGIPMVVTFHPAALLRNPQWKRPTWEDIQKLRALYDELTPPAP
jgi:DNA polymerase